MTDYREIAAEQGTKLIRQDIALRMVSAFCDIGHGYNSTVAGVLEAWIDGGMDGGVPYPECPFFKQWADQQGLSNCDGFVGYILTMDITPKGSGDE